MKSVLSKPGRGRRCLVALLIAGALTGAGTTALAAEQPILDCPLRDAGFSLESPLIDVMVSPSARAAVDAVAPQLLANLPPDRFGTQPPSMAAIMTLGGVAPMMQIPEDKLAELAAALAAVEATVADKQARCARYDNEVPEFELAEAPVKLLVFTKITGFHHGQAVDAATAAVTALAEQRGWTVAVTDRGGAMNPDTLAQFDAVVWNNVSGDPLTLTQRQAFRDYVEGGGGYLGIHGSGGDREQLWAWYRDTLLGAQFIGHPMNPQFQEAQVVLEKNAAGIGAALGAGFTLRDEWYSFEESPRTSGSNIVATLDESTYSPVGMFDQDLRMGGDHPIVWTRCVGDGRSAYTAIGHRPEVYYIPENLVLLRDALVWSAGQGAPSCGERQ